MRPRGKLCSRCRSVVTDILSWDLDNPERWERVETDYVKLVHNLAHDSNTVERLQASALECGLCDLIHRKVNTLSAASAPQHYFLFVTDLRRRRAEFSVACGDVGQYAQLPADSRRSAIVALSCRPGASNNLANGTVRCNDLQPYLKLLPFTSHDSDGAYSLVSSWLQDCRSHHQKCVRGTSKLPTRVLDLRRLKNERIVSLYTHEQESEPPSAQYAALSYVWGKDTRMQLCSTLDSTANPEMRARPEHLIVKLFSPGGGMTADGGSQETFETSSIPLHAFPATLKDFIHVAQCLDFWYIWLDSLCIVQNVAEDLAYECSRMTEIYENAELTVSASSSSGTNQGMLQTIADDTVALFNGERDGKDVHFCAGQKTTFDIDDLHVSKRGWCFQERLVSTSVVHYGRSGLIWECASMQEASHDSSISGGQWKKTWQVLRGGQTKNTKEVYECWMRWVQIFSGRELSYKADKLPAVAGIAKIIAQRLDLSDDSYLAGLWRDNFLCGLLWRRFGRVKTLARLQNVAPSWSWASVDGQLEGPTSVTWQSGSSKGPMLEILQCIPQLEQEGSFGRLRFDSPSVDGLPATSMPLIVRGLLQRVTVDRQKQAGERPQPWRERAATSGFKNTSNVECMLDQWSADDHPSLDCWALRVGPQVVQGNKVTDHFLLLARLANSEHHYIRIGTARCDENFDKGNEIPDSGLFTSENLRTLIII